MRVQAFFLTKKYRARQTNTQQLWLSDKQLIRQKDKQSQE